MKHCSVFHTSFPRCTLKRMSVFRAVHFLCQKLTLTIQRETELINRKSCREHQLAETLSNPAVSWMNEIYVTQFFEEIGKREVLKKSHQIQAKKNFVEFFLIWQILVQSSRNQERNMIVSNITVFFTWWKRMVCKS